MLNIAIINGPNLNLLGTRETDIYGNTSFDEFLTELKQRFPQININYYQSNIEGELIDHIQQCRTGTDGIVLNGAAYTHTSIGMADAIAAIDTPVIEVHISNIYAREEERHRSYTAAKAIGCITGLGLNGYAMAIQHFIDLLSPKTS